jgi:hypothetical protein
MAATVAKTIKPLVMIEIPQVVATDSRGRTCHNRAQSWLPSNERRNSGGAAG